jgi:hypothetical protein
MVHIRSNWGGIMNQKVEKVISNLLECFKTKNIPQVVAYSKFPIPNIPSSKWSYLNQLIMLVNDSIDCRGFLQWKEINRNVKKGAKAIYILVPYMKNIENDKDNSGDSEAEPVLMGFMAKPVFRAEDTEGEALDYEDINLPKHCLLEIAEQLGVSIKTVPGSYKYYGYFDPKDREIGLATPEEKTFYHELAHAAHSKVNNNLKWGQDPAQEIVAEFSAQVICQMVGKTLDKHLGNSYGYIEHYAQSLEMTPHKAVLSLLSEVDKVLKVILHEEE